MAIQAVLAPRKATTKTYNRKTAEAKLQQRITDVIFDSIKRGEVITVTVHDARKKKRRIVSGLVTGLAPDFFVITKANGIREMFMKHEITSNTIKIEEVE